MVIKNLTIIVFVVEDNLITSTQILNEATEDSDFWNSKDHAELPPNITVSGVANGTYIFCHHAESAKNITDSSVVMEDPPITPAGRQQLEEAIPLIRGYLDARDMCISHVFNSMLTKTIETAEVIVEAFEIPKHYAVMWLQEYVRCTDSPHHIVGSKAPPSSAVALNPFQPVSFYSEDPKNFLSSKDPEKIRRHRTSYHELMAQKAENTYRREGKEVFRKLDMSLALSELETWDWEERVVKLDLLQWASRTVRKLEFYSIFKRQ
jgi:bisphosphoglycerate-dependent phosphoglycerate mutase